MCELGINLAVVGKAKQVVDQRQRSSQYEEPATLKFLLSCRQPSDGGMFYSGGREDFHRRALHVVPAVHTDVVHLAPARSRSYPHPPRHENVKSKRRICAHPVSVARCGTLWSTFFERRFTGGIRTNHQGASWGSGIVRVARDRPLQHGQRTQTDFPFPIRRLSLPRGLPTQPTAATWAVDPGLTRRAALTPRG